MNKQIKKKLIMRKALSAQDNTNSHEKPALKIYRKQSFSAFSFNHLFLLIFIENFYHNLFCATFIISSSLPVLSPIIYLLLS